MEDETQQTMENMMDEQTTGTALTAPWPTDLRIVFNKPDGADAIIARVRSEALEQAKGLTVATKKDRDALASVAYQIAKRKTALDAAGKALNDDLRVSINAVDAERRKIRESLEVLQGEVRAPLTKWEADEAARVEALKARVARLRDAHVSVIDDAPSADISSLLSRVEVTKIDDTWQEFVVEAALFKDQAVATLRNMLAIALKRESDASELARLRKEAEDRAEADRVRIAAEQAEAARLAADRAEAYRLAQIEKAAQERAERAAADAAARVKAEAEQAAKEAAEREAAQVRAAQEAEARHARELADAKAREEAAERKAIADKAEAEARLAKAMEDAKVEAGRAAQQERDRLAAQAIAEATARAKREADTAHRAKIKGAISTALASMAGNATPDAIADALMAGKIPHIQVVM